MLASLASGRRGLLWPHARTARSVIRHAIVVLMRHGSSSHGSSPPHLLARVIDQVAHLLPAQGPISIFIHHNTLHAFEHLPFEEAVERAGERLGCEPFLAESRYRDKLASGRILARDVEALLRLQLGDRGA